MRLLRAFAIALACPFALGAQSWRQTAVGIGSSARVLIIGTHPEDEDNALIAWLSLGRHVETAYLSLTRGESGANILSPERQSALGVVRTAELLAERLRDGARQFFTRAYDFGPARSDSVIDAAWPHDSLLTDVVAVIRAFRPHVVISLFSETSERDPSHRLAARLAREGFALAGTSGPRLAVPPWTPSRLYTRVDSATAATLAIDVGEFDRNAGRSYAEIGADIRRLQRTQPPVAVPALGPVWRTLRLENGNAEDVGDNLFGKIDTTSARFRTGVPTETAALLDTLDTELRALHASASQGSPDSVAVALARVARRTALVRLSYGCNENAGVPICAGVLSELTAWLTTTRLLATRAFLDAAGIVVDGTVARELVAARDSVPATIEIFNGSGLPITLKRVAPTSGVGASPPIRDSVVGRVVAPNSSARYATNVRVGGVALAWWQLNGLLQGTWLHNFLTIRPGALPPQLIGGEDRLTASAVEVTLTVAGIDVPLVVGPLVRRSTGVVRGDTRHPLAGVAPISVLFERTAEYELANRPIDRLFRVYLSSALSVAETLSVSLMTPAGLKADSAERIVILPPFGERNLFFRLRGSVPPGEDTIRAVGQHLFSTTNVRPDRPIQFEARTYNYGLISRDYPHIATQLFVRSSKLRVEALDLKVPPRLRVAYVKGTEDILQQLGQLKLNVQTLDPALLSVIDLSVFSTVLIGADAFANDALVSATPALRQFMRSGGTVVVLAGGQEIAHSPLFPFPITFDSLPARINDPDAVIKLTDPRAQVLTWPNRITVQDFADWSADRARGIPIGFDPRYRTVLAMSDQGQPPVAGTLLMASVGKGMIVYSPLSLDQQIAAVNPGAARLFVNLLSAGQRPPR